MDRRFGVVKAECRRAALVPEEAGNGMVGQLLASALSTLTFAPKGMVEGGGAEGVLARADYLLEVGWLGCASPRFVSCAARVGWVIGAAQ